MKLRRSRSPCTCNVPTHSVFVSLSSLFRTSRLFQSHYIPFMTPLPFQNHPSRFQCTRSTIIWLLFFPHIRQQLPFNGESDATCVFFFSCLFSFYSFFFFFLTPARLNLLQPLSPNDVDVALIMYDMAGFLPGAMELLVDQCRPWETQNTLGARRKEKGGSVM